MSIILPAAKYAKGNFHRMEKFFRKSSLRDMMHFYHAFSFKPAEKSGEILVNHRESEVRRQEDKKQR